MILIDKYTHHRVYMHARTTPVQHHNYSVHSLQKQATRKPEDKKRRLPYPPRDSDSSNQTRFPIISIPGTRLYSYLPLGLQLTTVSVELRAR